MNWHEMNTYIGNKDFNALVDMERMASGKNGSCFDYIQNIYMTYEELGIKDEYIQKMWEVINYDVPPPEEKNFHRNFDKK